ncbi:LCP family protein [Embleya sp. NPDC008237]|uniref:LCP family protein n=1 Tax=Embleya sp. NPDC008237 TaxID=3363978 RepID=UPI0036E6568F
MNRGNGPHRGTPGDNDPLGGMDDADVADMWVMNPDTGSFELRAPGGPGAGPAGGSGSGSAGAPAAGSGSDGSGAARPRSRAANPEGRRPSAVDAASGREADDGPPRRRERAGSAPAGRAGARSGARSEGPPKSKVKKRLKWIAISVVGLLVVLAGTAYGYKKYLDSKISTTAKNAGSEGVPKAEEDAFGRKPLNIVLIGNDSRKGLGKKYGAAEHTEGLADVTILMHVSADRSNATLVSIPRDTMVQIPKCVVDGKTYPASNGPQSFNESLANGGPPCTVSTVDKMLGVQVDHYIMIDFTGVKKMTDAVDGVDMCISEPINDPVLPNGQGGTDLKLGAGDQNLSGETALKFLRARHAFGDGSDLARIKAQKAFLMALTRKLKSSASLTNVEGMFKIANIAVESLTVDKGLGAVDKLISLGNQLKKVPEKRMAFTTLPIEEYPPQPKAKVQPKQPEANNLMAMLRNDTPVTKDDKPAGEQQPAPPTPEAPKVDPATVKVDVRNGSGVNKRANEVAADLVGRKFVAVASGNARDGKIHPTSTITYPKGRLDAAKALAAATGLGDGALVETTSTTLTRFEVLIGKDFPATPPPVAGAPPSDPPKNIDLETADKNVCAPKKNK